ncbi:MAG: hypothetical protein LBD49_01705 [Oscillospiraceae bacterium]|jgi:hypothetical protein|nr:hypothetical protein [Oscillospiraceae bacterium]
MHELLGLITAHVCESLSAPSGAAYYSGGGAASGALELLCALNRYVCADVPRFSRGAVGALRARTGASVIFDPSPERVLGAGLAVLEAAAPGRRFSDCCVVYATRESYYGGVRWTRRVGGVRAKFFDGAPRGGFTLPAAYGAILRGDAALGGIIILDKTAGTK